MKNKIYKFLEYEKTNEIFGTFAKGIGKLAHGVSTGFSKKNKPFLQSKEDSDLGNAIRNYLKVKNDNYNSSGDYIHTNINKQASNWYYFIDKVFKDEDNYYRVDVIKHSEHATEKKEEYSVIIYKTTSDEYKNKNIKGGSSDGEKFNFFDEGDGDELEDNDDQVYDNDDNKLNDLKKLGQGGKNLIDKKIYNLINLTNTGLQKKNDYSEFEKELYSLLRIEGIELFIDNEDNREIINLMSKLRTIQDIIDRKTTDVNERKAAVSRKNAILDRINKILNYRKKGNLKLNQKNESLEVLFFETFSLRNKTDGRKRHDISGNILVDKKSGAKLKISQNLAKDIFTYAEKLYNKTHKNTKDDARGK